MFALLNLFIIGLAVSAAIEYQPLYHGGHKEAVEKKADLDAPAHYEFSYSVHDEHTGDIKSQQESRKGHDVHGQYTLIDADGYLRTVDYTADEHNGFQANVKREPVGHKVKKLSIPKLGHY